MQKVRCFGHPHFRPFLGKLGFLGHFGPKRAYFGTPDLTPFGPDLTPFWGHFEAPDAPHHGPKPSQNDPGRPMTPQDDPKIAQDAPRGFQEAFKRPHEAAKKQPRGPKRPQQARQASRRRGDERNREEKGGEGFVLALRAADVHGVSHTCQRTYVPRAACPMGLGVPDSRRHHGRKKHVR